MGLLRTYVERLKKLLPDPQGFPDGYVGTTKSATDQNGNKQYGYDLEPVSPGLGQTSIQFQYNGSDLGTPGTVDDFNVVSSWATLARASNTVTLTIPTP